MMINRVTKLTPCLLLAAACGTSTPPAPEMPSALSADIGPQGGALHGKTGTAFAGVDLVIPPGALAQKTKISIHPIIDETPLPELAERVGSQFQIGPDGLDLAVPAVLSLPVRTDLVDRFGAERKDVKTWIRRGQSWALMESLAEPTRVVAVAIDHLGVAAAGVRVRVRTSACMTTSCVPAVEALPGGCAASDPVCVESLGAGSPAPAVAQIATDGAAVYYLFHPNAASVAAARFDLTTRQKTTSDAIQLDSFGSAFNVNVDPNGRVWAGLGEWGNARFGFNGITTERYDVGDIGYGAVVSGDNAIRLSSAGFILGTSPRAQKTAWPHTGTVLTIPPGGSGIPASEVLETPGEGAVFRRDNQIGFWTSFGDIELYAASSVPTAVGAPTITRATPKLAVGTRLAAGPNNRLAAVVSNDVLIGSNGNLIPVHVGDSISDVDFDATGTLWAASATAPIVYKITTRIVNGEPAGFAVTPIRLTSVAPTSPLFAARIPIALRTLANNQLIALCRDRSFYRLTVR